jgi:acetyl esterase/lipase
LAGGHLASLIGVSTKDVSPIGDTLDKYSVHSDFMILVSPVIDMGNYAHKGSMKNLLGMNPSNDKINQYSTHLQVTAQTSPAFIVSAFNDNTVDSHNSILLFQALLEHKVSSTLHIFPQGGHTIALRNNPGSTGLWTELCERWMIEMGMISSH